MKKQLISNFCILSLSLLIAFQLINNSFFLWVAADVCPPFSTLKESLLTRSISKDPKYKEPYYSKLLLKSIKGNLDNELKYFMQINTLFPKDDMARHILGTINVKKGKSDSAMCDFSQVIKINKYNLWAYYERSKLFRIDKNLERALMDEFIFLKLDKKFDQAKEKLKELKTMFPENRWVEKQKNILN